MKTPLEKFASLSAVQITAMIAHAVRSYPYLEHTSSTVVADLAKLMIDTPYMLDNKPTPICASYSFLKEVAKSSSAEVARFTDRDFVFCIKMFGLVLRERLGVIQFLHGNAVSDDDIDSEVLIADYDQAKRLEMYVSSIHKHTKIQRNSLDSADNKLRRVYRDVELAKLFVQMVDKEGLTVGEARNRLRTNCNVKDHEFIRIREQAIAMGIFESKRAKAKSARVTIDDENLPFVESLAKGAGKNGSTLNLTQAVNKALRDLRLLTTTPK